MGVTLEYEQEVLPEIKRPKHQEDEDFTKIAFVQNKATVKSGNSSGVSSETQTNNNGNDTEESGSYIAPDRIVARLDVDAMMKENECAAFHPTKLTKSQNKASSTRSSVFEKSGVGVTNIGRGKVDTQKTAAEFFKKAQKSLSVAEFSQIRKSIVAMKEHGDKKDRKAYVDSAQEVIALCIKHDQYFGTHEKDHDGTLLFLFFTLLPPAYRLIVEQFAMKVLFKKSQLGQFCKNLPQEQYSQLLRELPKFLQKYWCTGHEVSATRRTEFLREAQGMLNLLREDTKPVSSSMASAFLKLVPSRFRSATQALFSELAASQSNIRLKRKEAWNKGENTLGHRKFSRVPTSQLGNGPATVKADPLESNASSELKSTITLKVGIQKISSTQHGFNTSSTTETPKGTSLLEQKPLNPYAKKPRSLSSYIGHEPKSAAPQVPKKPTNQNNNRVAPAYTRTSELAKSGKPNPDKKQNDDAVVEILREAEMRPFIKRTPGDIVRNIKSTVPANISCPLCTRTATNPMLSDCGHMACQSCWLLWLKRSETCPVCRTSVQKESLARLVFQDHNSEDGGSGGRHISLTQLCD